MHGEDLASDEQESSPGGGGVGSTGGPSDRKGLRAGSMGSTDDGPPSLITLNPLNPLSAVSGSSRVKEDLTCTAVNGGFPRWKNPPSLSLPYTYPTPTLTLTRTPLP